MVPSIEGRQNAPAFKHAVAQLRAKAAASGHQVHGQLRVESNARHTAARISVPIIGAGVDATSTRALLTLRNELLPATIGKLSGVGYAVTGDTAAAHDDIQQMKQSLPLVFAFVLMLAAFRSIAIAAISLISNLLSVATAYGVMVAVFQYGPRSPGRWPLQTDTRSHTRIRSDDARANSHVSDAAGYR